jgi:hypothetical protein
MGHDHRKTSCRNLKGLYKSLTIIMIYKTQSLIIMTTQTQFDREDPNTTFKPPYFLTENTSKSIDYSKGIERR